LARGEFYEENLKDNKLKIRLQCEEEDFKKLRKRKESRLTEVR